MHSQADSHAESNHNGQGEQRDDDVPVHNRALCRRVSRRRGIFFVRLVRSRDCQRRRHPRSAVWRRQVPAHVNVSRQVHFHVLTVSTLPLTPQPHRACLITDIPSLMLRKKMHVFAPPIAERSVNHIRSLQSLPLGHVHVLDHACGHVLKRWHQRVCDVCAKRVERIIRTQRAERVQRDVPRNARHELLPGCSHRRRWTVRVPSHPRESAESHSSVTSSSSTCCSNTPTRACCSNSLTLSSVVLP